MNLSANPAGLSSKYIHNPAQCLTTLLVKIAVIFPLDYCSHLLTLFFAYGFVLIKSIVHTTIWVIVFKKKTAMSLLSSKPSNGPILLKNKRQRLYNDLALPPPVCLLSLITDPFSSLNNSTLPPHFCTGYLYRFCTGWSLSLSLSPDFSSIPFQRSFSDHSI